MYKVTHSIMSSTPLHDIILYTHPSLLLSPILPPPLSWVSSRGCALLRRTVQRRNSCSRKRMATLMASGRSGSNNHQMLRILGNVVMSQTIWLRSPPKCPHLVRLISFDVMMIHCGQWLDSDQTCRHSRSRNKPSIFHENIRINIFSG